MNARKELHASLEKGLKENALTEFGYTPAYTLYVLEKLANREIHVDGFGKNDAPLAARTLERMRKYPPAALRFARILSAVFTDDNDYHARVTAILETARRFEGEGKKGL
ncbi:MAG: hypothetical protein Q8P02_03330 [Candidatus Micrarchaeota archaeon]|nr:hypothetical protein [Candidatus Micrarchaeota archaeon]